MSVGTVEGAERAESAEGGDGPEDAPRDDAQHLVKLSYHDSGIDIRDPVLHVTPATAKKVCYAQIYELSFQYHTVPGHALGGTTVDRKTVV